jgi:hypothetical protein
MMPGKPFREMSARELRRAMEREDRIERKAGALTTVSASKLHELERKQKVKEQLFRNGITVEHLKENYRLGWNDGFKEACEPTIKSLYAIIAQVLHEKHGFGKKRIYDVLAAVDNKMCACASYEDEILTVWRQIGLHLDFNEPFDRIREEKTGSGIK